jgi:hypothetical protein
MTTKCLIFNASRSRPLERSQVIRVIIRYYLATGDVWPSENSLPSLHTTCCGLRIHVERLVSRQVALIVKHDFYRVCKCKIYFVFKISVILPPCALLREYSEWVLVVYPPLLLPFHPAPSPQSTSSKFSFRVTKVLTVSGDNLPPLFVTIFPPQLNTKYALTLSIGAEDVTIHSIVPALRTAKRSYNPHVSPSTTNWRESL